MDIQKRLSQLPIALTPSEHADFVFVVTENKFQHFPARNWTVQQFQDMLRERLAKNYQLKLWHQMVIAISANQEKVIILPKFTHINELILSKN